MLLAVVCYCAVRFVSDLVGNHNIGFPTRRLILLLFFDCAALPLMTTVFVNISGEVSTLLRHHGVHGYVVLARSKCHYLKCRSVINKYISVIKGQPALSNKSHYSFLKGTGQPVIFIDLGSKNRGIRNRCN